MIQDWQKQSLKAFGEMYLSKTLKAGEQIVFGIKGLKAYDAEDEMAYIVLDAGTKRLTLTLCMERSALINYMLLKQEKQKGADKLKIAGRMLELNCLQCHAGQLDEQPLRGYMMRFDYMTELPSAEIVLRRCRTGILPDSDLSVQERRLLMAALQTVFHYFSDEHTVEEAVSKVSKEGCVYCAEWRMGAEAEGLEDELISWKDFPLSEHTQISYSSPVLENELQARRIKKMPVSGATLCCSVRRLPIPMSENPVRTPIMLAMVDDINGVVGTDIAEDYEQGSFELASGFVRYLEEFGRPARVMVDDERTLALIEAIAQQTGVKIARADELPQIDELVHAYLDMVVSSTLGEEKTSKEKTSKEKTVHQAAQRGDGICIICGKQLSEAEMKAHIVECAQSEASRHGEDNLILHISDMDDADYWMDIALKRDATLAQLDNFLRDVWLDCCDHESMFIYNGEEYYSIRAAEFGGRSMNRRAFKEMRCGEQLLYEYDFDTVTRLKIDVLGEFKAAKRNKKAIQLARNIQPQYKCICCGKPAEAASRQIGEKLSESVYCEVCGHEKSLAENLRMLPILNSPRCGLCSYGAWLYDLPDGEDK